jgi:predicted nucleotidyltransferase
MVQNKTNMDMEIILVLIRERDHLRGIARKLNESHSTVMRRINELAKVNVVDYKMEGKNKIFSIKSNLQARNYIYSAERYKLAKLLNKYPNLSMIFDDLLKSLNSRMIVLFGSYAKFSAKPDSDIDVYIDTQDEKAKRKAEEINSRIRAKTGKFDASSLLIREIIKNHVILRGIEEFYEKSRFFERA